MKLPGLRRHIRDERGSISALFGLSLVAMMVTVGLAVDYSRAMRVYTRAQAALDAAALAAAKLADAGATDADVKKRAEAYFSNALETETRTSAVFGPLVLAVNRTTGETKLSVDGSVPTLIGPIVGITQFKERLQTTTLASSRDIELGMMLDVSGSMQGAKLAALKNAGSNLLDILFRSGERYVKVALVPYSTSVNAGALAAKAKGNSKKNNTCVSERPGMHAFDDEPPSVQQLEGKPSSCPDNAVTPLSSDKVALNAALRSFKADGSTAGHLGVAWAWYSISPAWRDFWPAASAPRDADPKKLVKAVVLMTDGEFNTEYESADGKSAEQAAALCSNMKAQGITVFTVGFDAPPEVLPLLRECASGDDYAFDARDGDALQNAFSKIARRLTDLRIAG